MPEHRIRLRAGWDWLDSADDGPDRPRRVTLPIAWPASVTGTSRLVRRFGRPPAGVNVGPARIEMVGVPGLVGVEINGFMLAISPGNLGGFDLPLPCPLESRNVLILAIDHDAIGPGAGDWGSIALVFSPEGGPGR